MDNEEKKDSKKATKIFLAICIIWALYCLTGIGKNLKELTSEVKTINAYLNQIDRSIKSQ